MDEPQIYARLTEIFQDVFDEDSITVTPKLSPDDVEGWDSITQLRRVGFVDPETSKRLIFLTNHFTSPALTIAALYKRRWQVELFFKWIKQNLRIRHFYGTFENAVKTQIWTAACVYVLARN
jgi:IS4 transposase